MTNPARRLARDVRESARRVARRPPRLVAASPARALRRAGPVPAGAPVADPAPPPGVALHRDTLCYPLSPAAFPDRLGDYFLGGITGADGSRLLPDAVHYNGVAYAQSLPDDYRSRFRAAAATPIGATVYYGGILYPHFGHFLAESLGRLYAYRDLSVVAPYVLFHTPWGTPRYLERSNFAGQALRGLGLPVERIIIADRLLRLREVVVPEQRYGFGLLHAPDPEFVRFVRTYRHRAAVPTGFAGATKVYVSRSRLGVHGRLVGEAAFEQHLAREGYRVLHPQEHPLDEQLAVYSRASQLVFAEGSALLACVLLPDLAADVAVVGRRRDPQRSTRVATDCLRGYGKDVTWVDAVVGQYRFGLDTWVALSRVDWAAVSDELAREGFLHTPFAPTAVEEQAMARADLRAFVAAASAEPRFLDHLLAAPERLPAWTGPSHLVDPRDGTAVWP